ncbi:fibronectin type III domain-containing protein [Methylobacterium sp. E-046]|uniref:fibronectin type III domain-containing protein n=1 Tax=Methylobacterium sp. E-046 TaxID=2836576 RepID=UPI001FBC0CC3|nr:fibronectin type III domain-containing protein [Methylobacterium sp. E-046]MCJ2102473.1 fibronectin type III domain-containing protein [Methylobacterium sp. E-046]
MAQLLLIPPNGYGYTPPFSIYRYVSPFSVWYGHTFDAAALKPTATQTLYVGAGGDNAKDGLSWANRLRSLKQALVRAQALGNAATPRILVQAGTYRYSSVDGTGIQDSFAGQYYDGHAIIEPCDATGTVLTGGAASARRIVSLHDQVMPAFSLVSGSVYVSTYTTEVPSPGCADLSILNAKGFPQALLYAPPASTYANEAAIVAGVQAQATQYGLGACWLDTTNKKFYVQTANGRAPDSNIVVMAGGINTNQASARNLYLGGRYQGVEQFWTRDVHLWGGCPLYLAINQGNSENRGITYVAQDGSTLYSCINGVNVDGAGTIIHLRHVSDYSYKDGFNYDQSSALDPSATAVLRFHEIDCTADWNGNSSQSDDSDNASSCHMRSIGVRVNTIAARTLNRAFHDIQAAQTWNLGCQALSCRQTGAQSTGFNAGYAPNSAETAKMWLDGCISTGNAYDVGADKGGTLYTANMRSGLVQSGTGGTFASFNSPPVLPGAVGTLSAAAASASTVQLTFTAATGATGYQYTINGGTTWAALPSDKIAIGLNASTAYTFQVRAVNSDGVGAASNTASATTQASATPTNIVQNGDFASGTTSWNNFGFNGKSVSAGKATFANTPAYDGINQSLTPTAGKYYELKYTLTLTAGSLVVQLTGTGGVSDTERFAGGTFTVRLLVGSGVTGMQCIPGGSGFSGTLDDVSLIGPYNTATVGGA